MEWTIAKIEEKEDNKLRNAREMTIQVDDLISFKVLVGYDSIGALIVENNVYSFVIKQTLKNDIRSEAIRAYSAGMHYKPRKEQTK